MIKQFLFNIIFAICICLPLNLAFAAEFSLPNQPHIIVTGFGSVEMIPDLITLRFDVSATAGNFAAAKQEIDSIVGKALKIARKHSIHKEHINASKINASPQYEWSNQQRNYIGEQVSRQIELTLNKAEHYNDLVDDLLAAGITRLQPIQLDFSQRNTLQSRALLLALDDARQKAGSMANHLGATVLQVFQISEQNTHQPMAGMTMSARSESADQSAPLSLGKQKIEQQVQVVFLLSNNKSPMD